MKRKILLILIIMLSLGGTYAYLRWSSSNTNVTFNIEGCNITYNDGTDIIGQSFGPSFSKDDTSNVISKEVSMTPECSGVTAKLTLKVVSISEELKHSSFVWKLYQGDTLINEGDFSSATTNKVYTLLDTTTLTKDTTSKYTIYIYIDGNMDNPSNMGGKTFNFILGASGENALVIDSYTIRGTLLDSSNNPIPNALITVHSDPITTTTDSSGNYTLVNVPLGEHTVEVKNSSNTVIASGSFTLTKDDSYTVEGSNIKVGSNDTKILNITAGSSNIAKYEWVSPGLIEYIKKLDDGSGGNVGSGVYKVHHDEISSADSVTGNVIPAVDDYRYYGDSPDNYICLDMESSESCPDKHLYRIIGIIWEDLSNSYKLRVVKATSLKVSDSNNEVIDSFAWNWTTANFDYPSRKNIWAPVTDTATGYSNATEIAGTESGSTLMQMLNSEDSSKGLWWNGTEGIIYYYDGGMQTKTVNFGLDEYKISDKVKALIATSRFYLSSIEGTGTSTAHAYYTRERTKLGTRSGRYDSDRSYYWDGKVALMYASDYGYTIGNVCYSLDLYNKNMSKECSKKGWLIGNGSNWVISPANSNAITAYAILTTGGIGSSDYYNTTFKVFPTFYLKSDVMINGGIGSVDNPYVLS